MTISIGAILPVGTIIHSMLTVAQFEAQYGNNWVIADGRSVTGTLYESVTGASTIPDMRGTFLRSKGATYNPDGDLALGTNTADKLESHSHQQNYGIHGSTGQFGANQGSVGTGTSKTTIISNTSTGNGSQPAVALTTANTGSNETAPVSTTVNVFIRIN